MKEVNVYLDSSAIIKRYIKETGSSFVRKIYLMAYSGDARISFNLWNIGEVLGSLNRAYRSGRIGEEEYEVSRKRFFADMYRLLKIGRLTLVPINLSIIYDTWSLIEKYHVYEADALQIISAKLVNAEIFLTSDRKLYDVALKEGLNPKDPERIASEIE